MTFAPPPAARLGSPARRRLTVVTVAGLLALSTLVGAVAAASTLLSPGVTETGGGADVGQQGPAYWVWQAVRVHSVPTPVPTRASTTAAAPTLLPTTAVSYTIDPSTAGNTSAQWQFQETVSAPVTTELELRFLDGLAHAAVPVTIYLETRAATLLAPVTVLLYWDGGAFPPGTFTVATLQVDVLVCVAIGSCP